MKSDLEKNIRDVIAKTKVHKDTFAVPELVRILRIELAKEDDSDLTHEETVLLFVEKATQALAGSPIYSDPLVREFYRSVLDVADHAGIPRQNILEDLLSRPCAVQRMVKDQSARNKRRRGPEYSSPHSMNSRTRGTALDNRFHR